MIIRIKDCHLGFVVSVALHLCVVLLFVGLSSLPRKLPEVIVADLTLLAGSGGTGKGLPGAEGKDRGQGGGRPGPARKADSRLKHESSAGSPVKPFLPAQSESHAPAPTHHPKTLSDPVGDAGSSGAQQAAGTGGESGPGPAAGGGGRGGVGGTGTGHGSGGQGSGAGFGTGGGGSGSGGGCLQGGSDYYYIREMVMKNVRYPEKARRMGQEGRVVLTFIVLENGTTSEIRIVNSCGFRLLDESAREGVMNTVIHKKVPYRVVVTLPITYRLQ